MRSRWLWNIFANVLFTRNHCLSSSRVWSCKNVSQHFCECFSIKHLKNFFRGDYMWNKTLNIYANVLQMFYFTCNHGLRLAYSSRYQKLTVVVAVKNQQERQLSGSCCGQETAVQCSPADQWHNASERKWDYSSETESLRWRPCSSAGSIPHSSWSHTSPQITAWLYDCSSI